MAVNPTQNGISPISGLRYKPGATQEERDAHDALWKNLATERERIKHGVNTSYNPDPASFVEPQHYEPGTPGFEKGLSKYDRKGDVLTPVTSFEELQQRRYEEQPWWDVVANGVTKAVGRAATSFITGVAGAIAGGLTFLGDGVINGDWNVANFFDNPLSNALADLDDWANENFVNYKSITQQQNEQNGEWWKNITDLNSVMDDIVTNFGFIVGMGAASAVTGGVGGAVAGGARNAAAASLRAARRAGSMSRIAAAQRAAGIVKKYGRTISNGLTLINSSAGEAALEGLSTKREMVNEETERINATIDQHIAEDPTVQALDAEYQQQMSQIQQMAGAYGNTPELKELAAQVEQRYQQKRAQAAAPWEQKREAALQEMNESAERAGTATALFNLAILLPSNFNMYGRLIDKSFRNAEKSAGHSWAVKGSEIHRRNSIGQKNITGGIGHKTFEEATAGGKQYGSRSFLGNAAKRVGSTMLSEGVYEEMGQAAASTGAKAYHEWEDVDNYWRARLDPETIDRTADASHDFLKAVGQGIEQTYGTAEGWKEGFIGGISGGLFGMGEFRSEWKDTRFAKRTAKELNKQLKSDKLPSLLQNLVAQGFYANTKDGLAAMGRHSEWKTEDDKAAFALVSAFDRAGRMDDLYHLIDSFVDNMSDDDIDDMVRSSTRTVTTQEQIAQMKQEIRKNTAERVKQHLREGADMDDLMRARTTLGQRQQELEQAEQGIERARQEAADATGDTRWLQYSEEAIGKRVRARDKNARQAARHIRSAFDERNRARRAYDAARAEHDAVYTSEEAKANVDTILSEYDELNARADNSSPEEYLEGPFTDSSGSNNLPRDQVRQQLEHNRERIHQVVDMYKNAVEDVNRDTRGILSKEQEDYLAYTRFMAESSGFRANELVQKWRDILPERLVVFHRDRKTAANFAGVSEEDVVDLGNGRFEINTKMLTDRQFADLILHGIIRQSHASSNRDTGDGEATTAMRQSLAEAALDAIEEEFGRTGRRMDFNRDELIQDFNDVEEHFNNHNRFLQAYMDARTNPEIILTAKEKAMRYLRKKYNQAKARLRQKAMSIQELGDLSEDELRALGDYHYALARAEKLRRGIKSFWDSVAPGMQRKLERAFENIEDPELRAELIRRAKERIDVILGRYYDESADEGVIDVDAEEIQMMIGLDDLLDEDDPLWDRINKETKDKINEGISFLNNYLRKTIKLFNKKFKSLREYFDNLRRAANNPAELDAKSPAERLIARAVSLLSKARLSSLDLSKLERLSDIISDKIASLESSNSAIARALRNILQQIDAALNAAVTRNEPETEGSRPAHNRQTDGPSGRRTTPRSDPDDVAGTPETAYLQNPSLEQEEAEMTVQMNIDLNYSVSGVNGWQSVTGEFSRRSDFTYEPYHKIIEDELAKLPADHPEDKELTIKKIGKYGNKKTVAEWRRVAERSRIVHERLTNEGAFGYIDAGNIKTNDSVKFLISRADNGELIIYLVHVREDGSEQIIGDMVHPDYGDWNTVEKDRLVALYKEFERELGDKRETMSSHQTHAANVYAGFLKFAGKDEHGNIRTRTIASFGEQANEVEFHVYGANSSRSYSDMMGRANIGQPLLVLKRPGNNGATRRIGVPISTHAFGKDGIEMNVIQAAIKKYRSQPEKLQEFLKHFLNCQNVFISTTEIEADSSSGSRTGQRMMIIDVKPRVTDATAPSRIRLLVQESGDITISGTTEQLRANVSARFLSPGSNEYEAIASVDPTLPKTYTDFLKQICHVPLEDLQVHDSWITVNKITVNPDNTVTEDSNVVEPTYVQINEKGHSVVPITDSSNGALYLVEVSEIDSDIPVIVSIRGRRGNGPFVPVHLSELNKSKILPVMAQSLVHRKGKTYSGDKFMYNGMVYSFTLRPNGSINNVRFSEADTSRNVHEAADQRLLDALRHIARHYNGTEESLERVLKKWFDRGMVESDSALKSALVSVLNGINNGQSKFSISPALKARILNSLNSAVSARISKQRRITKALASHLKKHGINVVFDNLEEGQRLVNEGNRQMRELGEDALVRYGIENGVRFFLSNDGKIVYGFVRTKDGKSTIYLDPDIMNPETVIHEYTHLWVKLLRKENPSLWNKLVKDLKKKHPDIWETVKEAYGDYVKNPDHTWNEDAIADEVFAHVSGKNGERWVMDRVTDETAAQGVNKIIKSLQDALDTIINYIKTLFGVKSTAETLQELVIRDMLSDNPLQNLGVVEEQADDVIPEPEPEPEPEAPKDRVVQINDISNGMSETEAREILEALGVAVNPDGSVVIPDDEDVKNDLSENGFSINFNIDLDMAEEEHPDFSEIRSTIGSTLTDNLINIYSVDSGFEGLSEHIDDIRDGLDHGYLRTEDFLLALDLFFTEQQRNALWSAARPVIGSSLGRNYRYAARIQHMFQQYLQGNKTGNRKLDGLFRDLQSTIRHTISNSDELSRCEMRLQSAASQHAFQPSLDYFSELSPNDRDMMYDEVLDTLSDQDVQYLEAAGYTADLYRSLLRESKERIRDCIL